MSDFKTGNHGMLRQQNLAGIMHHLYENAPISRIELSRLTGLNKATVSSLINQLLENQFVHEVGAGEGKGTGRRTVLLDLNPARGFIVSSEIGVDFITVICADFTAEVIWRKQEPLPADLGETVTLERLATLMKEAAAVGSRQSNTFLGVSVAVPGLIDPHSGTLLFAPNLGWQDTPVAEILRRSFNVPIFVDNEATLAALGEQFFGAAEGYREVLYLSAGVGLGGGLVLDGDLYKGAGGFAAEFGHMTMNPQGEQCQCGNRGCWETQVSQSALFRLVKNALAAGQPSVLAKTVNTQPETLSIRAIVEAARQGDDVALSALKKVGQALGVGIASLVNVLNPGLVVFGGALSLASEFLLPVIAEELHRRALHWNEETTRIVIAKFGMDASVMGGVAKILQAVLANPAQAVG